ncbi:MAG: hypothetical protein IKM97_05150 [Clostridia bacterium]|nr:hypothetical protein [Clostridia bacterium]
MVFVCEDDKHTVEVYKLIIENNIDTDKFKIYYTTDLRQNTTSLNKSLLEFNYDKETGKFKVNNVDIKLLG